MMYAGTRALFRKLPGDNSDFFFGCPVLTNVLVEVCKCLHVEKWAYDFELDKTADGQGFFGFKRRYNAYFEVISYTKMVGDAKKRNAIFFDRLKLPSRSSSKALAGVS